MSEMSLSEQWKFNFHEMRHRPEAHLGLGDIRITMGTQDAIVEGFVLLEAEVERLRKGIQDAMNNIGVPGEGYPANVAEAYDILDALLAEQEQDDE